MVRIEAGLAAVGALLLSTGAAAKTVTYDGPRRDCTAQVVAALGGLGDGDTLVFPKGEYHFGTKGALRRELAPSNNQTGEKNIVFPLIGKRNVTIEGNGSVFVFHGSTFPFAAQESRGLVLRNFTVRTPLPVHAGFRVMASDEDGFTVRFEEGVCPWEVKDGELVFRLEDRLLTTASGKMSMHALDRFCVHYLVTAAADPVHDLHNLPAGYSAVTPEARDDGTVRFRYRTGSPGPSRTIPYAVGERLAINLEERRWRDAFFFEDCDGVRVENVTISRFGGMGLVAQRSGNLTYDGVKILPEPGDTVALTADMMQFIACYGKVTVQNCEGAHTMDDVIDVHGNYLGVEEQDGTRLRLRALHEDHKGFFPVRPGDDVEFVAMPSREIVGKARVATVAPNPSDRYAVTVTVEGPLPELKGKVYLENVSLYPDVVFRRNHFHHYPNLRFSGRGKYLIEDNHLEHGWSALLVLDLPDFWYESGRVTDMTIRNNTFIDCNAIGGNTFVQIGVSGWSGEKAPKVHGRIVMEGNRYEKVKGHRVSVCGVREFVNLDDDPHACTVKVTDCGARGDDAADDTAGFQKALDTTARPLEVVVPPGTYYLDGTAKVGSDTTIRCEPGARIVLSAARPHRRGEFLLTNRNKETGDRNIRLVGGVWDGDSQKPNNQRKRWDGRRESMTPERWSGALLDFRNVKGLVFRDLDLRNSHAFYVRLCLIDGFDFRRTRFSSERRTGNQDGFHLNGFCRNGLIEDTEACSGQTDDDLFAFNADDILWREINYDMVCGPIENVTVRNVRAPNCHGAVRLLSVDSPIRNVRFENIEAGNRCHFVNADAARYCLTPIFRDEDRPDGVGCLENIVFKDCRYWASEPLLGADEPLLCWETNMKGVVLENVTRDLTRDRAPQRPDARVRKCTGSPIQRDASAALDDDYCRPVRPIGVNGQVEWNAAASQFMYAPTFGFKPVAGAAKYRFELTDAAGARHGFTAESPNAALSPIWSGVPTGACALKVVGLGPDGAELGVAGERRFIRMASFDAAKYPKATMPYDEAARKILSYVFHRPYLSYLLENGKPDEGYPLNSYPSKMLGSQIFGLLHYARRNPSDRATALKMARLNADWLMKRAEPADSPLAYFTQTYDGRGEAGNNYVGEKFAGQHMLHYPAAAASALLAMWRETGETKYRDFAVRIADTYLKLQGEDGTWWQKMDAKTGKPVCDNRLVPTRVMPFLEEIAAVTGEEKYRAAAERAFAYIENGPMRDWCWDGQFEDIYPAPRYRNLSKYGPCDTAIYLLNRFPGDKRRLAQAREMLRFSEDQFVVWEAPHQPSWTTPVVLEQYHCYAPIDESVAKLISTYLALYRAEGNPTDLAKAKALGDVFTRVLLPDGRLRTYWNTSRTDNEHEDWVNGQVADAFALEELAAVVNP